MLDPSTHEHEEELRRREEAARSFAAPGSIVSDNLAYVARKPG